MKTPPDARPRTRPPTRPRTRLEQKEATRARLVAVARKLFTRHGYDGTSVAMLCRAARVTHGALYHHFPHMHALLAAVAAEIAREVAAGVQAAADAHEGWAQVEAASGAYLDACGDPAVQAIFLRDAPRVLAPDAFAALDHDANEPVVVGLLRRWIDDGLLRPMPIVTVARLLGAAFAEAGALIASSDAPGETRAGAAAILASWIGALRA